MHTVTVTVTAPTAVVTTSDCQCTQPVGTILFSSGFEAGFAAGKHTDWDAYSLSTNGAIYDDTSIVYAGDHALRAEITDCPDLEWAYESETISWPAGNKVYYEAMVRLGDKDHQYAAMGACPYLIEAGHSAATLNCCIEAVYILPTDTLEAGQSDDDYHQRVRLKYVKRDGDASRQAVDVQSVSREQWHKIVMLVDLSGANPEYSWWLDGEFIWSEEDTSVGDDPTPPTYIRVGASHADTDADNIAQVWTDCVWVYTE